MTDFNALVNRFDTLLEQEKAFRIDSLDAFHQARNRREQLYALQSQITEAINGLWRRLGWLPALASNDTVRWANAALAMNPVFLVLDTTTISPRADIIRLFVRDQSDVLYDTLIKSERYLGQANTAYTRILPEALETAPTLKEVWPDFSRVLRGRYILAYNLQFIRERLLENAKHYELPSLPLIGKCLQDEAATYFGTGVSIKLSVACSRIGHTLSPYPTAPERALGQLALLIAMSKGITSVQAPAPAADEAEPEEDHPF